MARDIKLTAHLDADDKLTPKAEKAGDALDKLEDRDVEVVIEGDTENLERDIDGLISKVDKLGSGEAANLLITSNATSILDDIARLTVELDQLDANDPRVDVVVDNIAQAQGDLDRLQAKAQEINGTEIRLNTAVATGGIDKLADSARGANSAMANMVGNVGQDLGAVAGVAGSAGVAIGQMAEYAADATLGGENLASALGSMAKVAGPIAALGLAVKAVGTYMEGIKAEEAFKSETADKFADALRDVNDQAQAVRDTLNELIDQTGQLEFSEAGAGFLGLGRDAGDLLPILERLGIGYDEFLTQIDNSGPALQRAKDAIRDMTTGKQPFDSQQIADLKDYIDALEQYGESAEDAAEMDERRDKAMAAVAEQNRAAIRAEIAHKHRVDDLAQAYLDAHGYVENHTKAIEENADATETAADRQKRMRDIFRQNAEAAREQADAVAEATGALEDMDSVFGGMERRDDVIGRIFDLQNAPLDAAASIRDIQIAIDELSDTAADLDLSSGLDVSDVNLDPLLDAIDAIRPDIQARISDAFAAGGPEAARSVAQGFVDNIFNELGGKVSKEDIAAALGFEGGIDAFINVLIDQDSLAKAQRQLDILVGLQGQTPYTAAIQLALDAGTITPEQAQTLVLNALGNEGVPLPVGLTPPTAAEVAEALAAVTGTPIDMPLAVDTISAENSIEGVRDTAETLTTMPVDADIISASDAINDAHDNAESPSTMPIHGNAAGVNGTVNTVKGTIRRGESMPIYGNYNSTSGVPKSFTIPVYLQVANAAAVGAVAGGAGRSAPDPDGVGVGALAAPAAPAATPAHIVINVPAPPTPKPTSVTIQAGVVGNRFDTQRTVAKALRRHQRINGLRP